MMTLDQARIKERMLKIQAKWKGKDHTEIIAHCRWRADRMIYRTLKRKLGKIDNIFGDL